MVNKVVAQNDDEQIPDIEDAAFQDLMVELIANRTKENGGPECFREINWAQYQKQAKVLPIEVAYLLNHIDPDTQPVWASESITLKVNQLHRILQGHYPEGLPLQQWIRPLEKLDIPITLRFRKAASEAVAINGLGMGPKTLMLPTWADVETHLQINGHYTGEPEDFAKLVKRAERNGLAALRDPDGNIPYAAVLHWLVKKGKGSPELIRHFGKRDLQTALDWV